MNYPAVYGKDGGDGLHSTCGSEEVSEHRLGGADGYLIGIIPKDHLDGPRLGSIVQPSRGPMGVDVIDFLWRQTAHCQCLFNGPAQRDARGVRLGKVKGIGSHAEADELGIDGSTSLEGMVQFLQDDYPRPLSHDKAVTMQVKGATGLLRFVIVGGHGP